MDLAALKNMNLKDLLSKFTGGGGILADKKLLVKFGIGFGSIIIFLIIYYAFVSPKVNDRKARIDVMNENQNKITEYTENIVNLEKLIKKIEPEFIKNSKLFHSRKEVEDLYQNISNFAMTNGLTIVNLEKAEVELKRIFKDPKLKSPVPTIVSGSIVFAVNWLLETEFISILPRRLVSREIDNGGLVELPVAAPHPKWPIILAYRRNSTRSAATLALIDDLRAAAIGLAK